LLGQQLDCEQLKKDQIYIVDKNYPLEKVNIILNLAIQNQLISTNKVNNKEVPNQSTIFPVNILEYF
jgi:hypothetical protein